MKPLYGYRWIDIPFGIEYTAVPGINNVSIATKKRMRLVLLVVAVSTRNEYLYYSSFLFVFFISSGGWVKIKLKLPHLHVSDTCVSI